MNKNNINNTKTLKIFLAIVTAMLIIALGFVGYVWFKLQTFKVFSEPAINVENVETNSITDTPNFENIIIKKDDLTESQQNALDVIGLDTNALTVTSKMIECAEKALGKERMDEINSGTAPTPLESLTLLGCIK